MMRSFLRLTIVRWAVRLILFGTVGVFGFSVVGALWLQYQFQDSAWQTMSRTLRPELDWQSPRYPSLSWFFDLAYAALQDDPRYNFGFFVGEGREIDPERLAFGPVGPQADFLKTTVYYDEQGAPIPLANIRWKNDAAWTQRASDKPWLVSNADDFLLALRNANPGDHILLLPGDYQIRARSIQLKTNGRVDAPIFIRAPRFGDVTLHMNTREGFHVQGAYWVFENLVIRGTCTSDPYCEHGFHIVGDAQNFVLRNSMIVNFNSPIKVNGAKGDYPDNGLVENSLFANERPRVTSNPVTFLDIVAASGWRVVGSVIADFAKAKSNRISYAGFFKGGSQNSIFERNLVMCEWQHFGGVRVGLSLGGGGTGQSSCRDGGCTYEAEGGVIRSNIIMNCPNDVGIYVNKAENSRIYNNLLVNTTGIDMRFPETTGWVFNNVLDGRIANRDDATFMDEDNLHGGWRAALLDSITEHYYAKPAEADFTPIRPKALKAKGKPVVQSFLDFCGRPFNNDALDLGPVRVDEGAACANLRNVER